MRRDHVLGAGVDRRLQHGIGARDVGVEFDHADMIEHEGDCAGFGEVASALGEGRAHLACGTVAIVGQYLDDDGDTGGSISLVADLVIALGIAAGRFLDRTVDIVLRHVLGTRRQHRGAQPRIHRGIGRSHPRGDGDLARQLSEQLGFRRILPPLAVHDVLELRMSSHASLRDASLVDAPPRAP